MLLPQSLQYLQSNYNVTHVCTYQNKENDEYQADFLAIFNQTKYDDDTIDDFIEAIYSVFKHCPEFINILEKMLQKLSRPNYTTMIALMFCYSYDYLHLMHPFVAYLIRHPDADLTDMVYKDLYLAMLEAL